jgi:hypothetical protein
LTGSGAAATTTAVALTFTLYYIVSIPRVWDKLALEIRSSFKTKDEITGQSTASLVFLDAVIHECILLMSFINFLALRLSPASSGSSPRETPPEGMMIDSRFVPGRVSPFLSQISSRLS